MIFSFHFVTVDRSFSTSHLEASSIAGLLLFFVLILGCRRVFFGSHTFLLDRTTAFITSAAAASRALGPTEASFRRLD
jgi:hypothetical protein